VHCRGFVFLAPKRLLADSTESVCLSLHNVTGTAHVSVDVLHPDSDDKITSTQHKFRSGKSVYYLWIEVRIYVLICYITLCVSSSS
jgi:hypothetical protein